MDTASAFAATGFAGLLLNLSRYDDLFSFFYSWVQVACPRLSIDWGSAFDKPLLSPYEVRPPDLSLDACVVIVCVPDVDWDVMFVANDEQVHSLSPPVLRNDNLCQSFSVVVSTSAALVFLTGSLPMTCSLSVPLKKNKTKKKKQKTKKKQKQQTTNILCNLSGFAMSWDDFLDVLPVCKNTKASRR